VRSVVLCRLRLIASAQGYHLNDHGLYPAIYREGDSVHNVSIV
jgi:hypothetical protein